MQFTADMLNTESAEDTNITLFTGTFGDIVEEEIDRTIAMDVDTYYDNTGEDPDPAWVMEAIETNFEGVYKVIAGEVPDILEQRFDGLFTTEPDGDAPVYIGEVSEATTFDPAGWGREYVTAPVKIDGPKLKAVAEYVGVHSIHDGRGISGFVRTADDGFWAQIQVIRAIMEAFDPDNMALVDAIGEMESTTGVVGEYITYPEEFEQALL